MAGDDGNERETWEEGMQKEGARNISHEDMVPPYSAVASYEANAETAGTPYFPRGDVKGMYDFVD